MPELPEVETVRRGLQPYLEGARIVDVRLNRADLRFPFPEKFVERVRSSNVEMLGRRGKYITIGLSTGETLILHLGMTGRVTIAPQRPPRADNPGRFHHAGGGLPAHDHVLFTVDGGRAGPALLVYNDARRFGFMDLASTDKLDRCRHFLTMGPEPLGNAFSAAALNQRLKGRRTPVKAALLDQQTVAGVGNIYACEALFRAGVSPRRMAANVAGVRAERLAIAVKDVLRDAIAAGGSTLRDFAATDGELGYFQHAFDVYDRAGEPCKTCGSSIQRIAQSGRSTFFCPQCQR